MEEIIHPIPDTLHHIHVTLDAYQNKNRSHQSNKALCTLYLHKNEQKEEIIHHNYDR
jgi:hypothetical protein